MNIFQRFRPAPPSTKSLGLRLLNDPQGVMQPMRIKRPAVQNLFQNALASRAMVSQPAPYGLATATSRGLAGFGRFGAALSGDGETIFGPFNFAERWSYADFMGTNPNWLSQIQKQVGLDPNVSAAGSYSPPPDSLMLAASNVWSRIEEARYLDNRVEAFAQEVEGQIKAAIAQADRATRQNIIVGTDRRWTIYERQRIEAFNTLKRLMSQVAQYVVPPTAASVPPTTPSGGSTMPRTPVGTTLPNTLTPPRSGNLQIQTANVGAQPGISTTMLVGGAAAVLAVGAAAYFLLKR